MGPHAAEVGERRFGRSWRVPAHGEVQRRDGVASVTEDGDGRRGGLDSKSVESSFGSRASTSRARPRAAIERSDNTRLMGAKRCSYEPSLPSGRRSPISRPQML